MRKYKYYIIATVTVILVIYLFARYHSSNENARLLKEAASNAIEYQINKSIEMSKSLVNKQLNGIAGVVDSLEFSDNEAIVLLYSGYDCSSCIDAGFGMIKRLNNPDNLYVVALQTNPAVQQQKYEYFKYIYLDDEDILRQELKFVPTPIMLLIDSTYKIKDAIAIDTYNGVEQNKFVKRVK